MLNDIDRIIDVLETTLNDYLSVPEKWTHSVSARNVHGYAVDPLDSTAVCWCASGALFKVEEDKGLPIRLLSDIRNVLTPKSNELYQRDSYVLVNDQVGRQAICGVFRETIEVFRARLGE